MLHTTTDAHDDGLHDAQYDPTCECCRLDWDANQRQWGYVPDPDRLPF
jgi:hypothetical protein